MPTVNPRLVVLCLVLVAAIPGSRTDERVSDEQRLLAKLVRNYNPAVRPVFNASMPVIIHLGITLTQILDVDEKNQVLTLNVWLDQSELLKKKWRKCLMTMQSWCMPQVVMRHKNSWNTCRPGCTEYCGGSSSNSTIV